MAVDLGKIGMTPKGEYDAFQGPYERLDVVTYEGSSYVSLIDSNSIPIGAVGAWQVVALRGETGPAGTQGEQGIQGIQGPIGEKGDKGDPGDVGPAGLQGPVGPQGTKGDPGTDGANGVDGTNAQSFNYKANISNYAGLPATGNVQNDAYFNEADSLWYIYNGTSFPADGDGVPIGNITIANNFDVTDGTNGQSAFNINDFLVNKVRGGESDDVTEIVEIPGTFYKNIGITLVGGSADGLQAGLYSVKTNTTSVADANKFLTKATVNLKAAGPIAFCIGSWDGTKFTVRWQSDTKTGVVGNNVFTFEQRINTGEIAGMFCLPTSSATISYGDSGSGSGNRFIQYSTTSGSAQAGVGSYYSIYFELKNIDEISTPSYGIFNLAKSVAKITKDYTENNYTGVESSVGETTSSSNTTATSGYAINRIELETTYILSRLNINATTAGAYTIAIGFIEQSGKFIEKKLIPTTLIVGVNNISFSEKIVLEPGDYVGLKFPSGYPVNDTSTLDNLWSTTDYTVALSKVAGKSLPIKLYLKEYISSDIVLQSDLVPITDSVLNVQQNFIHQGKKVNLIYNTDGTVSWEFAEGYSSILHLGNSIVKHPILSYWWGTWGMAASTRENDYANKFLTRMKAFKPAATMEAFNIAGWEVAPTTWDKTLLNPYLAGKDLITIRLGENATYSASYKAQFDSLVTYIQTQNPTAKIVIGGVFWADSSKDTAMSQVASEKGLTWVAMSDLDKPENKSFIGAQVMGDDGNMHTVNNAGVANHPGDLGMQRIADRLFNSLGI